MSNIVWSHSRINTLLNNPAEYYLAYIEGIQPKVEKTALSIGSAIHWGLEHQSSDLTPYYNEKGSFSQWNNYTDEQCLAECIVETFLQHKDEIFAEILRDVETGGQLEVIAIERELRLTGHLDSRLYADGHDFLGIIDLLLITNKGFILLDYKTSSKDVEWSSYKSQLFKYNFLLEYNFADIPLYKVGIINLKKANVRRKRGESDNAYKNRIRQEYLINKDMINFHCYESKEFTQNELNRFKYELSSMLDVGQNIVDNNLYFINYSNITNLYGQSQYYDIFYHTDDSQYMYCIKDTIFDTSENKILDRRDCDKIDMLVLENSNVLNKYNKFKSVTNKLLSQHSMTKTQLFDELKNNFICSDKLLEKYYTNYVNNI